MTGDWVAASATVVIGVAGLASTLYANRAGNKHAERLTAVAAAEADRSRLSSLYTEVVHQGRRLQRTSWNWTTSPTPATIVEFDQALDEFARSVAQVRLLGGGTVADRAVTIEQAFRKHSRATSPKVDHGETSFQLTPLIEAMRDELESRRTA